MAEASKDKSAAKRGRGRRGDGPGDASSERPGLAEKSPPPGAVKMSWWARMRPYRPFLCQWVLPLAALSASLGWAAWAAARRVYDLPRFQVQASHLVIENRPGWLHAEAEQGINQKAFRSASYSIFDPDLTRRIHEAYEGDPWVLRVEGVSKHFPNQVKVRLILRQPLGRVHHGTQQYVLDRAGRVLDIVPDHASAFYGTLAELRGIESSPPGRGEFWQSDDVKSAIEVLDALSGHGLLVSLGVLGVDVGNLEGRADPTETEILLTCPGDVRILWGRPIGRYGEIPVEEKLVKIETLMRESGAEQGVDWNVRFANGGIIRRAGPTQTASKR
ncbi:MAG: hypothetical protein HYU36_07070 [Planctomycetes bacterium]|nr:hypothetical protein [Planctomycetota bacterium]